MFPTLFTIPEIQLFGNKFGPIPVHSFGVLMVIAFFASLWMAGKRAERYGMDKKKLMDMGFWTLIAGVLGARVVFILQELPFYLQRPEQLLNVRFSGLTSFGGILFGLILVLIWARKQQWPLRLVLDVLGPPAILGHAIGRVGCLLHGCCFGGVCPPDLPWALHMEINGEPMTMHPAQIYDSLMLLAGLALVLWVEKRGQSRGQVFALSVAVYGLSRFIYEFWRAGTDAQVEAGLASSTYWNGLPITEAQAVAALMVVVGLALWVRWRRTGPAQQELLAT